MERLQARLSVAAWCIGAVAGLVAYYAGARELNPLLSLLLGILEVVLGGLFACGAGVALRYVIARIRKSGNTPDEGVDYVGAAALGGFSGGFLGLVLAMSMGAWRAVPEFVAVGGAALTFVFTMAGRLSQTMFRMLVLDSQVGAESEEGEASAKKGGKSG